MRKHGFVRLSALLLILLLTLSACMPSGTRNTDSPDTTASLSTGPEGSEETALSSDPVDTSGPSDPSDSTEPSESTEATDPTESAESTAPSGPVSAETEIPALTQPKFELSAIPAYTDSLYISLGGGIPTFTENQYTTQSYEYYSELDSLGRCGTTVACIGIDLMPTGDRGSISTVTPSGWVQAKYDIISGKYLYNRSHLIGWQLTGEDANKRNLITGTKDFNVSGMLPFENMVADYIKETGNHVLYRVTPIFDGNNLVASGVHMEAWSVEDGGDGVCFNVFVYNVQPGIVIDYATGESRPESDTGNENGGEATGAVTEYVLNTNSKKFHYPDCRSAAKIGESNREAYTGTREALIEQGYSSCGNCNP